VALSWPLLCTVGVRSSIAQENHRNKAMVLNACLSLSGDRAAAGDALSLANDIGNALSIYPENAAETQKALRALLVAAGLNANSNPVYPSISKSRQTELVAMLGEGKIYLDTYIGVDADHVILEGTQIKPSDDDDFSKWPKRSVKIFASREVSRFRIYDIQATAFSP
jgi:hypothetical protein